MASPVSVATADVHKAPRDVQKQPINFSNILVGAGMNMFEVTTLGQPFEVIKTTMAANRSDTFAQAMSRIWARGGIAGFYQGLIPWAWIEASTKGAILMFVQSEVSYRAKTMGSSNFLAGITGGMIGGVAQAYLSVGFSTFMKTVEITRHKEAASGKKPPSTFAVFADIYKREGIRGVNKGVNAVAIRQLTNWGSRFGFSRLAEDSIRKFTNKKNDEKLSIAEKISASAIGGALATWNQPIEVVRIEMQSQTKDPNRPKNLTAWTTLKYIYSQNGLKGLYRGVTPRIGLGVWQTVCMVALGDVAKDAVAQLTGQNPTSAH